MNRAIAILAASFLAASAFADVASDGAVESRLNDELLESVGRGVIVEAKDGVVTLTGQVRSLWAKRKAIELALEPANVSAVEDELTVAAGESDETVAEAVAKEVRKYAFFTVYDDVNIAVTGGAVVLNGRVTMPFKSQEIETRVSKILGVQSLANQISTLPTHIGDQRIRANLAYRIYGDSLFRDYAFRANPPIHIIVERGRVALTGAVRSQVERRKAEHIARQTFGVFAVENRLTIGD